MVALSIVWWSAAVIGVVALIVAGLSASRRRGVLAVAAAAFLVVGILGILSIGLPFLVLAGVCAWAAARRRTLAEP